MFPIAPNTELQFLRGEQYTHFYLPYEKIHDAPLVPGLYSWYLRARDPIDFRAFVKFFGQLALDAEVKGTLRLKYSGRLTKSLREHEPPADLQLLGDVITCAPYPLYMGISRDLRTRLATHKSQFEEHLARREQQCIEPSGDEVEEDTNDESAHFGARLASIWPIELPTTALYLKFVIPELCLARDCCKKECTSECKGDRFRDLRMCELFSNSLFNPVFGRR